MITLQEIARMDTAYLDTFSRRIDTLWGSFFYNEEQPTYYDANHAHIVNTCEDPEGIVKEITQFYQAKSLIPRLYLYQVEVHQKLIATLLDHQYKYEEFSSPVQLWDNMQLKLPDNPHLTVEPLTDANYEEALAIECSIREFGEPDTIKGAFREHYEHPAFTHYLLRRQGQPCSTACIFVDGDQARLESVATHPNFRGEGLIGHLIAFIQQEVVKRGIRKLWVCPINEEVEKVYQRYGFKTVAKLQTGHAFLGGKSIAELRA